MPRRAIRRSASCAKRSLSFFPLPVGRPRSVLEIRYMRRAAAQALGQLMSRHVRGLPKPPHLIADQFADQSFPLAPRLGRLSRTVLPGARSFDPAPKLILAIISLHGFRAPGSVPPRARGPPVRQIDLDRAIARFSPTGSARPWATGRTGRSPSIILRRPPSRRRRPSTAHLARACGPSPENRVHGRQAVAAFPSLWPDENSADARPRPATRARA